MKKFGEILAKFSVEFRPSISRESGHKKFHTNSSTHQDLKFHTAEPKFFHSDTLGVGGPKKLKTSDRTSYTDRLLQHLSAEGKTAAKPQIFAETRLSH